MRKMSAGVVSLALAGMLSLGMVGCAPKADAPAGTAQGTTGAAGEQAASDNAGLEAKFSQEECVKIAEDYAGAGGQAKGEALDLTTEGPITGGGTIYYKVQFNLGDMHYEVVVDAIDGAVISGAESMNGQQTLLDDKAQPIEGTEQPVADEVPAIEE